MTDQALIAEVLETARMLVREVTELRPGEQVLVISDYKTDPITVNALAAASREAGGEVTITSMSPRAINGDPFTPLVGRAIDGADGSRATNPPLMEQCEASCAYSRMGATYGTLQWPPAYGWVPSQQFQPRLAPGG